MSNALAVAATTLTLQNLLRAALVSGNVTLQPPDRARGGAGGEQLNVFLYQTLLNAAWRNAEMPRPVRGGELGPPPLALNLHYLLTAYADDEARSHQVLGRAMGILHDHTLLSGDEIRNATLDDLPDSDLHLQIEHVRVTPLPLTIEDLSKLWTGFSTSYRLSAAYEVAVVLIESRRPASTPLPVLSQGRGDRGPQAQSGLVPPLPTLVSLSPPGGQPSVRLGAGGPADVLDLRVHHLGAKPGTKLTAIFRHPLFTDPLEVPLDPPADDRETTLRLLISTDPVAQPSGEADRWPAGVYSLSLRVTKPPEEPGEPDRVLETNAVPFTLAPRPTNLPLSVARAGGDATATVSLTPQVRPSQRASLLIAGAEVPAEPFGSATGTLSFVWRQARPGVYPVRLRVDGVDSLLVTDYTARPPQFDPNQRVEVT